MLKLANLEFKRGLFKIGPISFELNKGEIMSISGKNGSGKTSIMIAVNNYIKPYNGDIIIDNKNIKNLKINEIARKISYVQQEIPEPMGLTVRDIMEIAGFTRNSSDEDIEKALNLCNIGDFIDRDFATLSGGEKRMVSIASGIYQDTDYILMDEPTSFLDIDKIHLFIKIIKTLKNMDKGILLVLHDINMARNISDKALLMGKGKVISYGSPEEAITIENLEKAYNTHFGEYNSPEGIRFFPVELDK